MVMKSEFTSLKSQRLSDGAMDQFVELLRTGRLIPGEKVPSEREMEELLGVSRASYREAVRVLEATGILRVIPGRGTWICDDAARRLVSLGSPWLAGHERDVRDLLQVREILEVRAVSMAAARATVEQLRRIEQALERIEEAVESGDAGEMVAADTAFHQAIADASGNRVLASAIADLYEHLEDTRFAMISIPGRSSRMTNEHADVLGSIASGDPENAAMRMAAHVRRVEREVAAAIAAGKLPIVSEEAVIMGSARGGGRER